MNREKVGTRVNFIERREFDFQIACLLGRDEWIVGDDQHTHGTRARSNNTPDPTETDNAERLTLKFHADKFLTVPTS